jgi:hypothetical protein
MVSNREFYERKFQQPVQTLSLVKNPWCNSALLKFLDSGELDPSIDNLSRGDKGLGTNGSVSILFIKTSDIFILICTYLTSVNAYINPLIQKHANVHLYGTFILQICTSLIFLWYIRISWKIVASSFSYTIYLPYNLMECQWLMIRHTNDMTSKWVGYTDVYNTLGCDNFVHAFLLL